MAAGYDNGISILPANGYFAEVVDRLFGNIPLVVILLKSLIKNSMPKLKIVISVVVMIWAGLESSQMATATQFSVQSMTATTHSRKVISDDLSFALAKKCTIKRYRRPH